MPTPVFSSDLDFLENCEAIELKECSNKIEDFTGRYCWVKLPYDPNPLPGFVEANWYVSDLDRPGYLKIMYDVRIYGDLVRNIEGKYCTLQ